MTYKRTPEQTRKYQLKHLYNMTLEQYEELVIAQDGRCAICLRLPGEGKAGRLYVDHDHACCSGQRTCGRCIRGLLCHSCNLVVGHAGDSVDVLASAITYLTRDD